VRDVTLTRSRKDTPPTETVTTGISADHWRVAGRVFRGGSTGGREPPLPEERSLREKTT